MDGRLLPGDVMDELEPPVGDHCARLRRRARRQCFPDVVSALARLTPDHAHHWLPTAVASWGTDGHLARTIPVHLQRTAVRQSRQSFLESMLKLSSIAFKIRRYSRLLMRMTLLAILRTIRDDSCCLSLVLPLVYGTRAFRSDSHSTLDAASWVSGGCNTLLRESKSLEGQSADRDSHAQ
ncbi:hypothetical protein MRB53_037641 [Persea americana]|nr:hypothetical protein MRB53_037641 [Persea americana]